MLSGVRNASYWSQILSSRSYVFPGQTRVERMSLGEEIAYEKSEKQSLCRELAEQQ